MTDFRKDDGGKPRFRLIPPYAELEVVKVLTHGGDKYGDDNWKNCDDWDRYIDALGRHLNAYRRGEINDPETDMHHLAHLMCCALFLLDRDLTARDFLETSTVELIESNWADKGTATGKSADYDPAKVLLPKDRFCRACD
jgi:hypothetical protein